MENEGKIAFEVGRAFLSPGVVGGKNQGRRVIGFDRGSVGGKRLTKVTPIVQGRVSHDPDTIAGKDAGRAGESRCSLPRHPRYAQRARVVGRDVAGAISEARHRPEQMRDGPSWIGGVSCREDACQRSQGRCEICSSSSGS
jgi:hypothetical protein